MFKRQKTKSLRSAKAVEVQFSFTKVTIMSMLILGLTGLIGYSGFLGVKSLWDFTHPKFEISLDSFKALGYIAAGQIIPNDSDGVVPEPLDPMVEQAQTDFLTGVREFQREFQVSHQGSPLLRIPVQELLLMGNSFCGTKAESIASGEFNPVDVIKGYQREFTLRYPQLRGIDEFISGIGNLAFDNLCKD